MERAKVFHGAIHPFSEMYQAVSLFLHLKLPNFRAGPCVDIPIPQAIGTRIGRSMLHLSFKRSNPGIPVVWMAFAGPERPGEKTKKQESAHGREV